MVDETPNQETERGGKGKDVVRIYLDGVERFVRKGEWVVMDLKVELKVDPAKVLAKITPHGLEDLDDSQTIKVHEDEKFMTHARSGGSS